MKILSEIQIMCVYKGAHEKRLETDKCNYII